jgi:uncharacterized membrane protein (DUF2068 family)
VQKSGKTEGNDHDGNSIIHPAPSETISEPGLPALNLNMGVETEPIKKRAPTLYAIIAIKLLKGALFASLAIVAYTLSDNNLPDEYRSLLHHLRVNPERKFWSDLAIRVGQLTEPTMIKAAVGTLIYSMFSLVEGVGLIFRLSWSGWLAIGESAFFIPIEIYELVHRTPDRVRHGHPFVLPIILALNIFIVWYLFQNRKTLFRHHHH